MKKIRSEIKYQHIAMFCLVVAGILFAGSALAGLKLTRISDSIYAYVGADDDSISNSYGANVGIIVGQDAVLVIDTLISNNKAKAFIKDIRAITDKPIRFVVNTHSHLDHSFGNSAFAEIGATIISHANALQIMKKRSPKILEKVNSYLGKEKMAGTRIVYPQLSFTERMEVDLGDLQVELRYITHSHTKGSVYVYIPAQKVLFAGDILFTQYYANMSMSDVNGWVETIDHLMSLDVEHIVPGHGPLSVKKDLTDQRDYLLVFDKKAKELSASNSDSKLVAEQLKGMIPQKPKGEKLIKSSLRKYIQKKK